MSSKDSTWFVTVNQVVSVEPHPYAMQLRIITLDNGCRVVWNPEDLNLQEGDYTVYCAPDTILRDGTIVRARRIVGILSEGFLLDCYGIFGKEDLGTDVSEQFTKGRYVAPEKFRFGQSEGIFPFISVYPKLERRKLNHIWPGTQVLITEKIHGSNVRFHHDGTRLYCGSHNTIVKDNAESSLWRLAREYKLEEKFAKYPNITFFAEVFGNKIQPGVKYSSKEQLAFFDFMDTGKTYVKNKQHFLCVSIGLELPTVPVLYHGPWSDHVAKAYLNGMSYYNPEQPVEGIVATVLENQYISGNELTHVGTPQYKFISDWYKEHRRSGH